MTDVEKIADERTKLNSQIEDQIDRLNSGIVELLRERDGLWRERDVMVKALEHIAHGAPETEIDCGDYDFSNSGDVIDYGIALQHYADAKVAYAALASIKGGA